jgi:hypothetical protein
MKDFIATQKQIALPKSSKPSRTKKTLLDELRQLKVFSSRIDADISPEAFLRIETIADFHDAVLLLVGGYDIGFEPVSGAISGFARPEQTSVWRIKRVSNEPDDAQIKRGGWVVKIVDKPASIANAARELICNKEWRQEVVLDLTGIEAGERTTIIEKAFCGLCRLLNVRAGRLLSRTDIADAIAWMALLTDTKANMQIAYGSSGWGHVLKNESDRQDLERAAPEDYRVSHTFVCRAQAPSVEHLTRIILAGHRVANFAECSRRSPPFAGTGPSGTILLPNHGIASRASLDGADLSENAMWQGMRLLARAMYRATGLPLFKGLQPVWEEQRRFHRNFGVTIAGAKPTRDSRNHALHGAVQQSNNWHGQNPLNATYLEGNSLDGLDFCDNGAAIKLPYKVDKCGDVVQYVLENWSKITTVQFVVNCGDTGKAHLTTIVV